MTGPAIASIGDPVSVLLLAVISLLGGIVVATVGPGGIFVVVGLYALSSLSGAAIAGTSSATFTAGAVLGSAAYARSDDVDWKMAIVFGAASAAGTRLGVISNATLSRELFGFVLSGLLAFVGAVVLYRELEGVEPAIELDVDALSGLAILSGMGAVIGFFGGLLGIGGAALTVPGLVVVGVPIVTAVAVTQVVVVFITAFTTVNYLLLGAIASPLVFVTGGAYLVGVGAGWRIAHRVDADRLKVVLGVVLLGLAASLLV